MSKLSNAEYLNNFWQELASNVRLVKSLDSNIKVSLDVDGVIYDNILNEDLKIVDGEVYIELTSKLRLTIFKKSDYELYFDRFYDRVSSTFTVAREEFTKVFKFHSEVSLSDLEKPSRSELIKEGLAKSGYKPTGKKPNPEVHRKILKIDSLDSFTEEEIAEMCKVGVATVYRVLNKGN